MDTGRREEADRDNESENQQNASIFKTSSNILTNSTFLRQPPKRSSLTNSDCFIQSISLTNFKSYSGSVLISPLYRFTSVIGPNASGKSNLLDAVMFVLNLPLSHLRVDDMLSLIYPGETQGSVSLQIGSMTFMRVIFKKYKHENTEAETRTNSSENLEQETMAINRYKVNDSFVGQKEYIQALETIPSLSLIKHLIVTQGKSIHPNIELLDTVEVFAGSHNLIPRYKVLEREYKEATRRLGVCFERRRGILIGIKTAKMKSETRKEFIKLNDLRDKLERGIGIKEMEEKRRELDRIDSEIEKMREFKRMDGYDEKREKLTELRLEAARIQKEYFEKEAEYYKHSPTGINSNEIERMKNERVEMENMLLRVNNELGGFERSSMEIEDSISLFKESVKELELQLSSLVLNNYESISLKRELTARVRERQNKVRVLTESHEAFYNKIAKKSERIKNLTQELTQLRERISTQESEYDLLVDQEKNKNEEMTSIVREILMNKARKSDVMKKHHQSAIVKNLMSVFTGVHGRVSELVKPTQKRYEAAVSAALSAFDSAVVVESNEVALDCIQYVKEAKAGRITFIVLNRMGKYKDKINTKVPENATLIHNCITYNKKYETVINFIFKDTVIVEDIQIAKQLLYESEDSIDAQIVTLTGVTLSKNGIISTNKVRNVFEEDVVEELLNRRQMILNDLRTLAGRKEAMAEVGQVKERIKNITEEIQREEAAEDENVEEDLKAAKLDVRELSRELDEVNQALSEFTQQETQLKSQIAEKERDILLPILVPLGVRTLSEYKRKMLLLGKNEELVGKLSGVNERIRMMEQNEEVADLKIVSENELSELSRRLEVAKERLRRESASQEAVAERRRELERRMLDASLVRMKVEEEMRSLQRMSGGGEIEDVTGSTEELRAELRRVEDRLREYGAVFLVEGGSESRMHELELGEAERELEGARKRAEELKEKFLEIKRERMVRFSRCFNRVAGEIPCVYAQLVGSENFGGKAHILFEGDPFANGLKYFLMPPGKAFTEFQELSGGEKVMALLAFIFSLGKFSGVPFYLFDEVDAALDRVHVEQLAKFLGGAREQFLVVSLKPQFFQYSEALVGVYRCPRDGCSKTLTYRLTNY